MSVSSGCGGLGSAESASLRMRVASSISHPHHGVLPQPEQLLKALGPNAAEILTLFADNVIAQWKINDPAELRQTMSQLTILIATLNTSAWMSAHRRVSFLYFLHGRKADKFLCNARFKRADKWHIRVSPDLDFPIVRQHKYLGVIIFYGSFKVHTLEHLIHCASTAFPGCDISYAPRMSCRQRGCSCGRPSFGPL